mmetsp:Transcript_14496/g.30503  ORF Transcript_14496/g.30503 Transcript_14496/m.30503 type:complete len:664 (-) Transcript_14496:104-2095(-)
MSFTGSTQLTMSNKSISKLLLRRNTTPIVAPETDVEQNNDAEGILVDHQDATNNGDNHHQPTPSHKRKQSDTVALGNVEKILAGAYSETNLESVVDGDEEDNDDGLTSTHPLTASFDGVTSGEPPHGGTVFFREKRWHSYPRNGKIIAAVVLFVALLSLRSSNSSDNDSSHGNMVFPNQIDEDEIDHLEVIGEPIEAQMPTSYNWVEFYDDIKRIGPLKSKGPSPVNPQIGGLYSFENVCVTNNIDGPRPPNADTTLRGLVYFTKDKSVANNPKRCVPCAKGNVHDEWGEVLSAASADSTLNHPCGIKGLHAMYGTSVEDWDTCMANKGNRQITIRNKQNQSPSHVERVHFFEEPTLLLQFQANDRESALFDTLLTYIPHWHIYKNDDNNFPFKRVLSHSVEGCLSHSRNWFCELTHQLGAYGHAKEILWETTDDTLYCFKSLFYNQLEYQRNLAHDELLNKAIMDDFRDELNRNFALSRPRDMTEIRKKDAKLGMTRPMKIALYGGDGSNGSYAWNNLEELVQNTQSLKKYHGIVLDLVTDLNERTIAEQARTFNEVDAIVMAMGDHMANAVFATDDISFVEVGCGKQSLIGNARFMALILGTHRNVEKCHDDHEDDDICALCSVGESHSNSFTITQSAFHEIIDDLVKAHQEKISFIRDTR